MIKLEPFVGKTNKERRIACLGGEDTDRVPIFEILKLGPEALRARDDCFM